MTHKVKYDLLAFSYELALNDPANTADRNPYLLLKMRMRPRMWHKELILMPQLL